MKVLPGKDFTLKGAARKMRISNGLLRGRVAVRGVFIVAFAAIGAVLLFGAHAATGTNGVSVSPQNGTLASGASVVPDQTAIGRRAVQFNGGSSTGGGDGSTTSGDPGRFGMALGSGWQAFSTSELNSDFADLESIGVQWVRFDIEWSGVQPSNAQSYSWTAYDNVAKAAQQHNLKVLGILDAAPKWAQQSSCAGQFSCPPNGTSAFATFAAAAATHYAPLGVTTWEIYNEENNYVFWQSPNAASYTALLKAAYAAIHQAESGDFVISGGLAPAGTTNGNIEPNTFVQQMYAAGAHGYFDALGDHPYCYSDPVTFCATTNASSTDGWGMMAYGPNNILSIMKTNGDSDKKIWMTEFGAPDSSCGCDTYTTAQSAQVMQQAYDLTANQSWAGPLFWYTYTDGDTGFGILDANGNPKPAYAAYKQLTGK